MPILRPRKAATWSSLLPFSSCAGDPHGSRNRRRSSPASTISSVDLPEPDGPTMPVASPGATSRLTPLQHMHGRTRPRRASATRLSAAMTGSVTEKLSYMEGRRRRYACDHMGLRAWLSNLRRFMRLSRRRSGRSVASTPASRAEPYRIVGFGDSLMAGYGLDAGRSFPEKLEAALRDKGHDVVIANAGVSGDTTSGGLARLDWSVPDGTQTRHPRTRRQRHAARRCRRRSPRRTSTR